MKKLVPGKLYVFNPALIVGFVRAEEKGDTLSLGRSELLFISKKKKKRSDSRRAGVYQYWCVNPWKEQYWAGWASAADGWIILDAETSVFLYLGPKEIDPKDYPFDGPVCHEFLLPDGAVAVAHQLAHPDERNLGAFLKEAPKK